MARARHGTNSWAGCLTPLEPLHTFTRNTHASTRPSAVLQSPSSTSCSVLHLHGTPHVLPPEGAGAPSERVVFQSHAHVSRLAAPHTNTPLAWIGGRLRRPQHGDARDGARRPARTVPRAQDTLCTADTRCSETNSSSAWLSTSALSYRRSWCAAWRTLPRCKLAPQHDSQMEALPSALSQHAR